MTRLLADLESIKAKFGKDDFPEIYKKINKNKQMSSKVRGNLLAMIFSYSDNYPAITTLLESSILGLYLILEKSKPDDYVILRVNTKYNEVKTLYYNLLIKMLFESEIYFINNPTNKYGGLNIYGPVEELTSITLSKSKVTKRLQDLASTEKSILTIHYDEIDLKTSEFDLHVARCSYYNLKKYMYVTNPLWAKKYGFGKNSLFYKNYIFFKKDIIGMLNNRPKLLPDFRQDYTYDFNFKNIAIGVVNRDLYNLIIDLKKKIVEDKVRDLDYCYSLRQIALICCMYNNNQNSIQSCFDLAPESLITPKSLVELKELLNTKYKDTLCNGEIWEYEDIRIFALTGSTSQEFTFEFFPIEYDDKKLQCFKHNLPLLFSSKECIESIIGSMHEGRYILFIHNFYPHGIRVLCHIKYSLRNISNYCDDVQQLQRTGDLPRPRLNRCSII